ncbi:MAG: hypothetical protein WC877_02020 [Dehalococcoidales bacterium]|jgi:hypothetical protein
MKVEFYLSMGYVNCKKTEIVEFDDNATDEEIDEDLQYWIGEQIECNWKKVDK